MVGYGSWTGHKFGSVQIFGFPSLFALQFRICPIASSPIESALSELVIVASGPIESALSE
jgi:hypothetical protein